MYAETPRTELRKNNKRDVHVLVYSKPWIILDQHCDFISWIPDLAVGCNKQRLCYGWQ